MKLTMIENTGIEIEPGGIGTVELVELTYVNGRWAMTVRDGASEFLTMVLGDTHAKTTRMEGLYQQTHHWRWNGRAWEMDG